MSHSDGASGDHDDGVGPGAGLATPIANPARSGLATPLASPARDDVCGGVLVAVEGPAHDAGPTDPVERLVDPRTIPQWGPFYLTYSETKSYVHGRWMARCPFHRKSEKTGCTRTATCSSEADYDRCRPNPRDVPGTCRNLLRL